MFERMLAPRRRLGRWPMLFVATSVAVHVGVAGALLIKDAWAVELLPLAGDADRLTYVSAARPPGASAPRAARPKKPEAVRKRRVRDVVQPQRDESPPPDEGADASITDAADSTADDGADTVGFGDSIGVVPGGPGGEGCPPSSSLCRLSGSPPPPPPPPAPKKPRMVAESEMPERIAGDTAIAPADADVAAMARDGVAEVVAVARPCLDTAGRVSSVELLRRTGYPGYDRRLVQKIRQWRYRPFMAGGEPAPVCTVVRFVFRLR